MRLCTNNHLSDSCPLSLVLRRIQPNWEGGEGSCEPAKCLLNSCSLVHVPFYFVSLRLCALAPALYAHRAQSRGG